jgi:hypothetical protein
MEIELLKKMKVQLEADMLAYISNRVMNFTSETGFSPRSIDIDMSEVTVLGDEERQFVPIKCKVRIDLF